MEFGHKLRRLGLRSFPTMCYLSREIVVKDKFIQNLEGEMRRHVILAHPKTLDQAISIATEFENVTCSLKTSLPYKSNTTDTTSNVS